MQLKTLCAVICTVVVLSIHVNEGAPTTVKSTTAKVVPSTVASVTIKVEKPVLHVDPPVKLAGARTAWSTKLDSKSKKIFQDYKKIIVKKLQAEHKLAATFNPKPEKVAFQTVSGALYHYLVKTPNNKYAYVTVHHRGWKKDHYGKEANVTVRPKLYELTDKNI